MKNDIEEIKSLLREIVNGSKWNRIRVNRQTIWVWKTR
jgi:hypothetical protein